MSIYNIIAVTSVGIVTGLFNMLLSKCGYVAPSLVNGETVAAVQSVATKNAITFSFVGLESITAIILIVILAFINVEKHKKTILFHTRCGRNQEKGLHSLRHTFATKLVTGVRAEDGTVKALTPRQVADLLGHTTSEITEMYYVKRNTDMLMGVTNGFEL